MKRWYKVGIRPDFEKDLNAVVPVRVVAVSPGQASALAIDAIFGKGESEHADTWSYVRYIKPRRHTVPWARVGEHPIRRGRRKLLRPILRRFL